jgi:hypothetical protein
MRLDSLRDLLRDIIWHNKEEIRLLEELKRQCPTEAFAFGATKEHINYLNGAVAAFEFVAKKINEGVEE